MSSFLNSLENKLTAMEQDMQALPAELDSIVARLDKGKLGSLLSRLNQDCNKLFSEHFATQMREFQMRGVFALPYIVQSERPYIRPVTSEDFSRWQEQYKSKVLVVIGNGKVEVMTASDLAKEHNTTVPQISLAAEQQGYIVLGWDQYQKLLDEIGKLISGDEEQGGITRSSPAIGIPLPIHSTQEVKILPKSPPL